MLIITIKTDKPEAEIGLYEDEKQLAYETWHAHRTLAETIHDKLKSLLASRSKELHDVDGIVVFKGPGSFTGLRIGITVANTLAYSLDAKIIAAEDPNWLESGISKLLAGASEPVALPEYGAAPHITIQKK
jgi:tRNA threonylcarbamoyladenosine biosynthesis protein TsaB